MGYSCAQDARLWQLDSILNTSIHNSEKAIQAEILFEKEVKNPLILADMYYPFSKWNWKYNKDQKKAKDYALKEFAIRKKYVGHNPDDKIKRNLYNLGVMYRSSTYADYYNALAYLDTLVSISSGSTKRLGNTYRIKGDIYDALGDSQKALENYEFSESIFKVHNDPSSRLKTLINIAGTYITMNDGRYFKDFENNQKKILAIHDSIVTESQKAKFWYNSAAMLNIAKSYNNAIQHAEKALVIFRQKEDSVYIFDSLNLLGVLYKKQSDFDNALVYANESKKYAQNHFFLESKYFNNIADVYLKQKNFESAIEAYKMAVRKVLRLSSGSTADFYSFLDYEELSISPYKRQLFGYLNDLTNALLIVWKYKGDMRYVDEAKKVVEIADALVDYLFMESSEELSKLSWREKSSVLYINGITIAHVLNEPETAMYYMEKNKGLLLLENITNVNAKQKANIPKPVISREYDLLSTINRTELEWSEASSNYTKEVLKKQIFTLKQDYNKFIDSLESSFPAYYKYKQQLSVRDLKTTRAKLQQNEAIISYAIGNTKAFVIYLSKDEIQLKELIVTPEKLNKQIAFLQTQLERPFQSKEDKETYQETANMLFNWLFPFEDVHEKLFEKTVYILPDGTLYGIPFEALALSSKLPLNESYLLNVANVSYKYSLSVEGQLEQLNKSNSRDPVGFFLTKFENDYQPPFTQTETEIEVITTIMNTEIYKETLASKSAFIGAFKKHNILHVSTHGGVKDGEPWLAFYDEPLFLNDLYFLENQKELVVLSACKTSNGVVKKGEGIFSLTRGFINAGTKSLLATLWDVSEKPTLDITTGFYENLRDGKRKSEALWLAKKEYLKKHGDTSESSPYYWSAIIHTGNDKPLYARAFWTGGRAWVLLAPTALFLFGLFRWRNKVRYKQNAA